MGIIPKTPIQFTPRLGCHYLFHSDACIQCVQSPQYFPGLDIRGEGGYILVAPSHACRRHYMWNPRRHPLNIPLAPFPDWIRPCRSGNACQERTQNGDSGSSESFMNTNSTTGVILKSQESTPIYKSAWTESKIGSSNVTDTAIIERAHKYVATCDPAIQGSRGHDKLLWAATTVVHGFCLSNRDAYDVLAESYNPRCIPPWDLSVTHERNDFARKITEARSMTPRRQRGWLLNS